MELLDELDTSPEEVALVAALDTCKILPPPLVEVDDDVPPRKDVRSAAEVLLLLIVSSFGIL